MLHRNTRDDARAIPHDARAAPHDTDGAHSLSRGTSISKSLLLAELVPSVSSINTTPRLNHIEG